MRFLLSVSGLIDRVNKRLSVIANWLVLLSALVSAGNAFSRYAFSLSSNAWLEIQWYMFGAMVMLGASFTLKKNEHVRVDIVYTNLPTRAQIWVDILGGLLFLLPAMTILCYLSWPVFYNSWVEHETSANAGGLLHLIERRWPQRLLQHIQDLPADALMLGRSRRIHDKLSLLVELAEIRDRRVLREHAPAHCAPRPGAKLRPAARTR